ncbi:MAG: fused MFS/spermidine synthase [Elusimicrobia bacterium]|nr:fused MFS/spermidine synthase [Elusimicrobiota bacterium]MDE2425854.1 fused MFS/spermidine synthase [Elusimicrobiota bacterium]
MRRQRPEALRDQALRQRRFLLACLFCTGACALILEILGTRLISPYYGSSLYCWSALITVTLAALAWGYQWGGALADRTPVLTLAARLLAGAALTVAAVPALRMPALQGTAPLGVELGALVSAAILVAPSLILLSALGPLSVRLLSEELACVGRSAGQTYAVSTLGSVLGAALAGFVLVPHLSLSHILYGLSILLLLLSAWAHQVCQRRLPLAQPAAAAALALFGFWPRAPEQTNLRLIRESAYGQIKVLDFDGKRYLLINGTSQSTAWLPSLRSDAQYQKTMELAVAARPRARSALVIGLGAGLLSRDLSRMGLAVDSVELDPAVVDVARRWFAFSPSGTLAVEDGRRYLETCRRRYDLIFLDAFNSEAPPFQLFTRESFELMRRHLNPGGLLSINLLSGIHGRDGEAWRSAERTLASVFPEVSACLASETLEDLGNVVFFAADGRLPKPKRPLEADGDALLLSDDYAPLESLLARASVRWRLLLQKKVSQVLLY